MSDERSEGDEASEDEGYEFWIVDRIEAGIAVLVEEEGEIVVELAVGTLGAHAVEGAVLRVPLGSVGEPVWSEAARDTEAEAERLADADEVLDRLKARDPGGDIET